MIQVKFVVKELNKMISFFNTLIKCDAEMLVTHGKVILKISLNILIGQIWYTTF